MKHIEGLQKFLSLGYLYLISLGILQQSVFYQQIGVNIFQYSSLADILISPIATLATKPIVLVFAVAMTFLFYLMPWYLSKNSDKNWVKKAFFKNKLDTTKEEIQATFKNFYLTCCALGLLAFFLGLGLGSGGKLAAKIANNELEYNNKISFDGATAENVHLISVNSLYCFYVVKGSLNVKIAPISTIKNFELIAKKQ